VDHSLIARLTAPNPSNDKAAVAEGELCRVRVDPGELDHNCDRGRRLAAVDVHGRTEPAAGRHQAGNLAQVREQLFHLVSEAVGLPTLAHETIVPMGRWVKIAAASLGFLLYVWVAAVGRLGHVRAAKRARRDLTRSTSDH